LISCISACGKCVLLPARHVFALHNRGPGFSAMRSTVPRLSMSASLTLTQASTGFATDSLYRIPQGADEEALVMLSDILPTGFECGVLNGKVAPGSTVAIVGSGPIGLAALLTAQLYSSAEIIMIDLDDNRLEIARKFGATQTINSADGKTAETVMTMTGKRGVDAAIEAVGIPVTFELCEKIIAPGGTIAHIGVHGTKVDVRPPAMQICGYGKPLYCFLLGCGGHFAARKRIVQTTGSREH
jgi:alcohol dehydrogenase